MTLTVPDNIQKLFTSQSRELCKTLDRNPLDSVDHTILIDECQHAKIALDFVDLGEGQKTMVRGVCTGDYLSCASGEADVDEECYYPSQAHNACTRVEAIPAVASTWTQSCTLHGLECPQVQADWSMRLSHSR